MTNTTQIEQMADAAALAVERPAVAMMACGRCAGSALYRLASGAMAPCTCEHGRVPATRADARVYKRYLAERELVRLRAMWKGYRALLDTLRAEHHLESPKSARRIADAERTLAKYEAAGRAARAAFDALA